MSIDHQLLKALHVETLRHSDLHPEHDPHVIFQTSTFDALLEGSYDGDVQIAELAQHGDLGLGTFHALDGEMIVVDGHFYRADFDGNVTEVDGTRSSPFAAVMYFDPDQTLTIDRPHDHEQLVEALDQAAAAERPSYAIRIDGRFEMVKARSVPRQYKPYPRLAEVAKIQHVFELGPTDGTMVGFRFPDYAGGLNVAGYHLHFITPDRKRGGHVLDCRIASGTAAIDHSSDLHVELPTGIELGQEGTADRAAIEDIEGKT